MEFGLEAFVTSTTPQAVGAYSNSPIKWPMLSMKNGDTYVYGVRQ